MTVKSRADELKAEIAALDKNIENSTKTLNERLAHAELWRDYIDQLRKRRKQLEAQLEREDTVLVKPTGPCVTLTAHDGVKWDV